MQVFVTADGVETFNRLQVSANSGSTPFDIGRVDLTEAIGDTKNLGDSVFIHDDGPAILLTPTAAMIAVDESLGTTGSTKDEPGNAANNDETTAGAPAGAIGYAVTAAATLFSEAADAGTDGQASKVYALVLNSGATGLIDTASGQAVVLSQTAGGVVEGRTATSNLLVFTIAVDSSSGAVTTTQYRALNHGADGNNHDGSKSMASGLVELQATLTDGDTDTASHKIELGSRIGFEDDGPAISVENASGTFAAGAQGAWDHDPGSDTFASLSLTLNSYKIGDGSLVTASTSLGTATTKDANGNYVFPGSITADFTPNDGLTNPQTANFTLTFDPDDPESYTFALSNTPTTVILRYCSQGQLRAGGPDPMRTLLFGGSEVGADDVVFFGVVANAPKSSVAPGTPPNDYPNDLLDLIVSGATDLTEDQIQAFLFPTNQISSLINSNTQMNVSTAGIGINNNNLDGVGAGIQAGDESFVFNPEEVADRVRVFIDNSVGGYTPASGEELYYTVFFTNGTVLADQLVTATMLQDALRSDPTVPKAAVGGKYFDIDAGDLRIDAIQLTMGNGTVKIPVIQWAIEETFSPAPLQVNLTAELYDGDGDWATATFSVNLASDTVL
ncbi:DUF5801 repeats-in-toxin domain-containing protein [Falsiroseomonas oryziterrae]|uniref:DUF5801 repeats-in-toxin domain-containing protein n=1 Tax=Falsiroseomonas oryziterrae TaxID=2911368 RepID=UPI001F418892|nr:DUF5801 repeats-in-toxin domain-containing protein [Roseomonas sp. NPKOSM-4]